MHDDPLRAQSAALAAGGVLGAIAIAACLVLAMLGPQSVSTSAPIVIAHDSGALYVRIGDALHPVLNLASARLVARSASNPVAASEASISSAKRGSLVGIPGAPARIGTPVGPQVWTVCDGDRTVVTVGDAALGRGEGSRAVLVTPRGESAAVTYLLYEGRRARVDLRDTVVVRALRLTGVVPVPVSRTLLDVLPEVPALAAPRIEGAGAVGPQTLDGARVGQVVRVLLADTAEYYVVLADAVQAVGEVTADLLRFTYDRNTGPMRTVAPAAIASTPAATALRVSTFPHRALVPVGVGFGVGVGDEVCARWSAADATTAVSVTAVAPGDAAGLVTLAQADGTGPNVDAVGMPAGRSIDVRSAPVVGDDGVSGPRYVVDDAGVVFGVHDDEAAKFLGLRAVPDAAPWPILAQLLRGPELSVDAASVLRDGLAAPS